jgi:hypothetical protein
MASIDVPKETVDNLMKHPCNNINILHLFSELIRLLEVIREVRKAPYYLQNLRFALHEFHTILEGWSERSSQYTEIYVSSHRLRRSIDIFLSYNLRRDRSYLNLPDDKSRVINFFKHQCPILPLSKIHEFVNSMLNLLDQLNRISHNMLSEKEVVSILLSNEIVDNVGYLVETIHQFEHSIDNSIEQWFKIIDVIQDEFTTNGQISLNEHVDRISKSLPHNTSNAPAIWPEEVHG